MADTKQQQEIRKEDVPQRLLLVQTTQPGTPEPFSAEPPVGDVLKVKANLMTSLRSWMNDRGFLEIYLPEITNVTGSCETIANIWIVKGEPGQFLPLRQTAQLYMEELLVQSGIPRMHTSGRSFRKEKKDIRHLADFQLYEWESLDTNLSVLLKQNSELIKFALTNVLSTQLLNRDQRKKLSYWYDRFVEENAIITYKEAIAFLQGKGFPIEYGDDLKSDHEYALTQYYGIVQVTHYPEPIKFFNMLRSREEAHKGAVDCVDLLLPYAGETIGGSAREFNYATLREKLETSPMLRHLKVEFAKEGGNPDELLSHFDFYLNLFKDAEYPRSGAGLGLGRLLQFVLSMNHIIDF